MQRPIDTVVVGETILLKGSDPMKVVLMCRPYNGRQAFWLEDGLERQLPSSFLVEVIE